MATSEAETLELYRVSLHNAGSQPEVSAIMTEYGYGPETLAVGKGLLADVLAANHSRTTERNESSAAYHAFATQWDRISDIYALHRRKAKAAFNKEPVLAERIGVLGSMSRAYVRWLETVQTFYTISLADAQIQEGLARVRLTTEELNDAYAMIPGLEAARAVYIQEKGETQQATKLKDAAFALLDDWMRQFYAIARIALAEKPQLLESLGKLVRS